MTDKIIMTPIDELLNLVLEKERVKLKEAAKRFGVKKQQLEEWAKILESHDLITIHYPPLGDVELRKKVVKTDKKDDKKEVKK